MSLMGLGGSTSQHLDRDDPQRRDVLAAPGVSLPRPGGTSPSGALMRARGALHDCRALADEPVLRADPDALAARPDLATLYATLVGQQPGSPEEEAGT